MKQFKQRGKILYFTGDYIAALLAWGIFFLFRKINIEQATYESIFSLLDKNFIWGIIIIPFCWTFFYFILGTYTDIYKKSRLYEFTKTILTSLVGVIAIFFALLLDDVIIDYRKYYTSFINLFALQFIFTFLFRYLVLSYAKINLNSGKVGYITLMIGGNKNAVDLYKKITNYNSSLGYKFVGFIDTNGDSTNGLNSYLNKLGKIPQILEIIDLYNVEEVVIAIETSEHHLLSEIMNALADKKIIIKIIPDMYDILSGSVKMNNVLSEILIEISPELIPYWQKIIKRGLDIFVSCCVLIILSPLYLFIAIKVKLSSDGPIIYKQLRIGLNKIPFTIYKFRSMYTNAENNGPQLSKTNDERITPWGKVMRKWRFDELPQFYNVLIGEMSLVGPRPERKFFIDQLVQIAPHYKHLFKVRPGLTSWGMVKFGYASTIDEMLERMKFDVLYIENMSLAVDFRIMIYTFLTILQGRGK